MDTEAMVTKMFNEIDIRVAKLALLARAKTTKSAKQIHGMAGVVRHLRDLADDLEKANG